MGVKRPAASSAGSPAGKMVDKQKKAAKPSVVEPSGAPMVKRARATGPAKLAEAGSLPSSDRRAIELEERYAAIFSVAPVGIAQLSDDRRIEFVNDQLCEILGHAREQLIGHRLKEFSHPDDNEATEATVGELIQVRTTMSLEKRFVRGDGRTLWARMTMTSPTDERFPLHRVVVIEDITARKEAEERLEKLSQLHLASGEVNEAILRTRDRRALLEDACEIIVKHCGFEIASVRLASVSSSTLELAATAGPLVGWMRDNMANVRVDSPEGSGLGPEAFRSGRPCVTNDYTYDARFFGRETPEQRAGLRSAAAFPLKRSGRSSGVLLVGSRERELFDDGLVGLLEHIAENVSYALEKIDQEIEQDRAGQALRASEARFRSLVELATDVYWEQDAELRFTRVGDTAFSLGMGREQVIGRRRWELAESAPLQGDWSDHQAMLQAHLPFRNFEYRHQHADGGGLRYLSANGEPIYDAEGRFAGYRGTARDITAAKMDEWALRRFRAALDQSAELVLLVEGGSGRILDFNESVCRELGYARDELLGQSLDKVVVGRKPEEIRERNRALLEVPDRRDEIRRVYRRKDGSTMEVEVVRQAVASPGGSIVVAIARDLTHRLQAERRAMESEERFRQLVENIPQVFWILDVPSNRLLYISPSHARLFGNSLPVEPSPEDWMKTVHEEDREHVRSVVSAGNRANYSVEYRAVWPDGTVRWVLSRAFAISNEAGVTVRIAGIAEDVTDRRMGEQRERQQARHEECIARFGQQALAEKEVTRLLALAAESVRAGLGVRDVIVFEVEGEAALVKASLGNAPLPGARVTLSPATRELLAQLENGVQARAGGAVLSPELVPAPWSSDAQSVVACSGGGQPGAVVIAALSPAADAFSSDAGRFLEAVASIIATALQRHQSESRLAYLAQFDSLTGLANRSLSRDRLAQAIEQAKRHRWRVAVLFVDLDRFKLVNDTLGHSTGDELLAQASRRLSACVRHADTVGRISGDEFALVLTELAQAEDAAIVSRKVLDALTESFKLGEHEAFVSASIGIAVYPGDGEDAESLLKNADTAMYRAKEQGRNGDCFFTTEMNLRSQHRLQLAGELRRALERSEFFLHYQPKVDLADGAKICGLEALLRWQHPERGVVLPNEFIPVLEETGLIMPVGEWVLNEACRQVRAWQDRGLSTVPVAVNISARQFRDKALERLVQECTAAHGIKPRCIELEITESHLMDNPEIARTTLRTLREAGVSISVDDFGTGYSSLSYLTQFPLSALKIDRSFVQNVTTDPNAASIVRAIINMARSLRFITIAEGVETDAQASFLRQFGCEQAQGFLFAHPMSAQDAGLKLAPASVPVDGTAR